MLSNFLRHFKVKLHINYSQNFYQDYFDYLGGMQFGGGLFSAFRQEDVPKWKEYIVDAFPNLEGKIYPFGYSWDGVCFCVDLRDGKVIVCDVGAADCYAIPCSMADLLNRFIPEEEESVLQSSDYWAWVADNGMLKYGSCAGLKVPLFMGGKEVKENREVSDLEVYWGVIGQVKRQIKG